jgi:DNA invertase Pin-like site-specific DNA recombinase
MSDADGYTRLSQESDTSIDRQKRHIREYAEEHGLNLVRIHDDGERSSGFDENREEYQALRDRVESGDLAAVIVNDKRRLARDFDETMRLVLDLREHDVEAHTYQEGKLDLSEPVQAAVEVLQAASEHEAKKKEIERAKEAVQERLDSGHDHGRPPIGLRFDEAGEQWVPDREDRFEDVVEAIEMVENGATYSDVQEAFGIAPSTMSGVMGRRDRYLAEA